MINGDFDVKDKAWNAFLTNVFSRLRVQRYEVFMTQPNEKIRKVEKAYRSRPFVWPVARRNALPPYRQKIAKGEQKIADGWQIIAKGVQK